MNKRFRIIASYTIPGDPNSMKSMDDYKDEDITNTRAAI